MTILGDFIGREREHYALEEVNLFLAALGEVDRYLTYLEIIMVRHAAVGAELAAWPNKMTTGPKGVVRTMTPEDNVEFARLCGAHTMLAMDHESFCLFGAILLDRAAAFIERYFGPLTKDRISNHYKLKTRLESYALGKALTLPEGFADSVRWLQKHLCTYRGREVVHDNSLHWTHGMILDPEGRMHPIKTTFFLPQRTERRGAHPIEAKPLHELKDRIDRYVGQLIALIEANRAQACFHLKVVTAIAS